MPKPEDIAKALQRYEQVAAMSMRDPTDMSGQYNTALTPQETKAYQAWLAKLPEQQRNTRDYDLQGAFKAGAGQADNGHLPDTFKKPSHPTFSAESQYSGKDGNTGGTWNKMPNGKWQFIVPAGSVKKPLYDEEALRRYFQANEPDASVVFQKANQ